MYFSQTKVVSHVRLGPPVFHCLCAGGAIRDLTKLYHPRAMRERRQDSPPHLLILFALTMEMHCSLDLKVSKIKLNRITFSSYVHILMLVQFALPWQSV